MIKESQLRIVDWLTVKLILEALIKIKIVFNPTLSHKWQNKKKHTNCLDVWRDELLLTINMLSVWQPVMRICMFLGNVSKGCTNSGARVNP